MERRFDELIPLSVDPEGFEKIFVPVEHDFSLSLPNENQLNIYHLRIENRKFLYNELVDFCVGNLIQYVFNRNIVNSARTRSEIQKLFNSGRKKFREIRECDDKGAGGELGELLLYLFLEIQLNAPKLLSKMEIKTTRNQYIYGADGVHLYLTKDEEGLPIYQFIVGESKIKNDILAATRVAFESIKNSLDEIDIETALVSTEILKEVCTKEEADIIKCIIEKDQNNYIYKLFEKQLDDSTIQTIYDNFKDQVIDDDSNVTLDQIQKLDKEIAENRITYPETIDYESVKSFLEQLYILFQWEKYESKMEIGKKERLAYYAVLLSQWMMGHSVRRIIDKSIEYHRKLSLTCIQPGKGEMEETGNSASLVLALRYGDFDMLFTGDVEGEGEKRLVDHLQGEYSECVWDVLKTAHHGSGNSTTEEFLKTAVPQYAFISAGENNSYGHPHKETLERLKDAGAIIYSTQEEGAVTIVVSEGEFTISGFK